MKATRTGNVVICSLRAGALNLACAFAVSGVVFAQATITTYAGNDSVFAGNGQPAVNAQLAQPFGVAVDPNGNVFVGATGLQMVLKVARDGIITVVAGDGLNRFGGDGGLATAASLSTPQGVAVDGSGNVFIADSGNFCVRKVTSAGLITTVAGNQNAGFSGDNGPALQASMSSPSSVAVGADGSIYIADFGNARIRKVTPDGIISTIAGNGIQGTAGDGGPATKASLWGPQQIALDGAGNVYVADELNSAIRKITPAGIMTTVAGTLGSGGYSGDGGPATKARLGDPSGVAVDAAGNLYIADANSDVIREVSASTGNISTIAGTGQAGFSGDGGPALAATFSNLKNVAVDSSGNVFVVDGDSNRIRRVSAGTVSTYAGSTLLIGDGGPSASARLSNPSAVAVDSSGDLYIADTAANRVREVTPAGTITTFAGTGQSGESGDSGPAASATLSNPAGVAVDSAGNLYIATGQSIRKVDLNGNISTVAGGACCAYTGDGGPAIGASLLNPTSVAVDPSGNFYFNNVVLVNGVNTGVRVRRVSPNGIINTFAGNGTTGFSGDGGPALKAALGSLISLGVGPDGSLYIVDTGNGRVRRVDASGNINTVAGSEKIGTAGEGVPATSAELAVPLSVTLDNAGTMYIGCLNGTVRRVTPDGIISTYAGTGQVGFSGDGGPAIAAMLSRLEGLATDAAGNLYIDDQSNNRIRLVQAGGPPSITVAPISLTFMAANASATPNSQNLSVTNTGAGTLTWSAAAITASGGAWLTATPATGSSAAGQPGATVTVSVSPAGLAPGDYYGTVEVSSPSSPNTPQVATVRLTVTSPSATAAPQVSPAGLVHGASFTPNGPVAPGTIVSIFGTGLADQTILSSTLPLPNQLAGASVTLGGRTLPLLYVSDLQINAQIPFGLPANTSLQVVVTRDNMISAPEQVAVVPAEPGAFTVNQSGAGAAVVTAVHTNGTQNPVDAGHPAMAGDVLVIYCTGLGEMNPRAVAGFPIPVQPDSVAVDPVTATIGGVNAPVQFAGGTSGFVGLYQVNVAVPSGIPPSSATPLILIQNGQASRTVTIATN
jgi:trimeric autotransporter adhesin